MYTPEYVHRSGMSTNIQQFRGKVANLLNLPLTTDLQVCDFVTHKALRSSNREVKVARVLRLQDGVTGEYFVDVVHNGKCFANIWERDQTGEYMDAPEAELPSEKAATYLLLKRLGGRRQQSLGSTSLRRRRGEDIQVRPQIGHSNDLCGPQHVRRKLERDELNKWDRDLPGKFVLDMKA
ncbi:hypothetical protein FOZ61_004094 [Perkinsus olseni]|uniref:Uncharacterized protein n=1 Tax=Perkinsus olseni TaxID=32597 RepID=A0A7J6LM05_PEROL|nr:hypothetical protein FOZ61_004094 [Perkinsus olseni]